MRSFHLDRLDIRVNGVPLYGTRGLSLRDTLARICERTMLLPLSPGENRIEVSVFNEQGVESLRETASIHYEQPSGMARPPDLYVAALGVSKYQDERFNLRYASKDARDIMTFFRRQEERFGAVHTLLLTDEEVTKEALDRVRRFLTPARFGDQVILFLVVYEGTMEISTLMG
jgi:hypothetical protein